MNCDGIEREEIIERCVTGALSDSERDELEEHYFGCEECFHKLQTYRAVQSAVGKDAQTIRTEPSVRAFPRMLWPTVALAAAGFIAFEEMRDRKSTRLNSSHVSESRMPS